MQQFLKQSYVYFYFLYPLLRYLLGSLNNRFIYKLSAAAFTI